MSCLSSQPCEELFRELRSMSSTKQTVVNFTSKELTDKLKRIHMRWNIMYRNRNQIHFPTLEKYERRLVEKNLPSDDEIKAVVLTAYNTARKALMAVGIGDDTVNMNYAINWRSQRLEFEFIGVMEQEMFSASDVEPQEELTLIETDEYNATDDSETAKTNNDTAEDIEPESDYSDNESVYRTDYTVQDEPTYDAAKLFDNFTDFLNLKTTTTGSRHTFQISDNNEIKIIKKATIVWMLTSGRKRLSADRQRRFIQK